MIHVSGWISVERGQWVDWDLEMIPLQIQTDSHIGSGNSISIEMFSAENLGIVINLYSPVRFKIGYCTNGWKPLPIQPTDKLNNIWEIAKTNTFLTISCNGVRLLVYNMTVLAPNVRIHGPVIKWIGSGLEVIQTLSTTGQLQRVRNSIS